MQPLTFRGRVERGEGMARRLGCPTANIAIEQGIIIPALGIYVGEAEVDHVRFPSLICVSDGRTGVNLKMEVHLLDQEKELGGKSMTVVLLEKLRDIIPYPGEEEMAKIIRGDMEQSKAWFKSHAVTL
ncbi:MAG: riboflavin kinase [Candidatus Uhrbacteria bacterium]|nr:riboflavin kinase [Candidatus Uhrbacteria bacterium]